MIWYLWNDKTDDKVVTLSSDKVKDIEHALTNHTMYILWREMGYLRASRTHARGQSTLPAGWMRIFMLGEETFMLTENITIQMIL